jgi:NtrC-family two-component system sensor histidine kinase KinB
VRLRSKLLVAQIPVFLALAFVAAAALWIARELGDAPGSILHENFRSFDAGRGMLVAVDAIDREVAAAAVRGSAVDDRVVGERVAAFQRDLSLQNSNITEEGETHATERLVAAWDAYVDGIPAAADPAGLRDHSDRAWELRRAVDAILQINRDAMRDKADAAAAEARTLAAELVVAASVSLLLALAVTGVWIRRLLSPLRTMEHAVHRLAAGDFEARITVVGDDEVAMLARSVDDMARRIDEYRKSSLGELLHANNRLESVMDSLPDAVLVYDLAGSVLGHNRVAAELLGEDRLAFDTLPEGLAEAVRTAFERVRADGEPYMPTSLGEAVEVHGPRGPSSVMVGATPVRGASGAVEGVTVALRDVTKARRLEGFRADLVAAAAHELKTPLTSLHMAVHLCLEGAAGPLGERQTHVLHGARQDCERLEDVVDELLEMAKLESGSVRLEPQAVPIGQLVQDAVARHEGDARRQGTTIEILPADATLTVSVDLERIRHVFDNVIENAIKYGGESGRVQIGWRRDDEDRGVRVYVDDAGPGVPIDMRERVFAKFVRVPGTGKRGSGLGLNIVRDVVAAHGGTIGIEDSPLGGARVWFVLPRGDDSVAVPRRHTPV